MVEMLPSIRRVSIILLVLLPATSTFAIPLQILSRSVLSFQLLKQLDERYLEVELKDDRGRALSGKSVRVSFGSLGSLDLITGADGTVRVSESELRRRGIGLKRIQYRVTTSFDGDDDNSPAEKTRSLNFGHDVVSLDFVGLYTRIDLDEPQLVVQGRLRSAGLGLAAQSLRFSIDGRRRLTTLTDSNGVARFVVPRDRFPAPGKHTFALHFEGTDFYAPAKTQALIELFGKTALTLAVRLQNPSEKTRRLMLAEGTLRWRRQPLPAAIVVLTVGTRRIAAARTDAQGRYRIRLGASEMPTGKLALQARFAATRPGIASARSALVHLFVPPFPAIPLRYYLLPLLLLVPIGLYLAIRRVPGRASGPRCGGACAVATDRNPSCFTRCARRCWSRRPSPPAATRGATRRSSRSPVKPGTQSPSGRSRGSR